MSKEKKIDSLCRKRDSIRHRASSFKSYVEELNISDPVTFNAAISLELSSRIQRYQQLLPAFDEIQDEIEACADGASEQFEMRNEFENEFHKTSAVAINISNNLSQNKLSNNSEPSSSAVLSTTPVNDDRVNTAPNVSDSNSPHLDCIKLPIISLPKFSGNYDSWLEYRETFESLIHLNSSINNVQKFHYLKASLAGGALQVISSIEMAANNYIVAYNTLRDRYNNTRLLVHNHVQALFALESVTKESSLKIRNICDSVLKHLRALDVLGQPTSQWDTLIAHIISTKLDNVTLRQWEQFKASKDVPTLDDLLKFLKSRADILETLNDKFHKSNQSVTRFCHVMSSGTRCVLCKGEHSLHSCSDFIQLPVNNRMEVIKRNKLCFNCFRGTHFVNNCRLGSCKRCGAKHNTLLHVNFRTQQTHDEEASRQVVALSAHVHGQILLPTAYIHVLDKNGRPHVARALLDSGSQCSFIREGLCSRLGFTLSSESMIISGLSRVASTIKARCNIKIRSTWNQFRMEVSCLVLLMITGCLPNQRLKTQDFKIPRNIRLADCSFNSPAGIDVLLGADCFLNLLCVGQISLGTNKPILQKTVFGWVVSGSVVCEKASNTAHCYTSNEELANQVARFWELEEVPSQRKYSNEEQDCEGHFVNTTQRLTDGRFMVSIPFKKDPSILGQSRHLALNRFLRLERKMTNNMDTCQRYKDFLIEYEFLGRMLKMISPDSAGVSYYLPHHCVLKEESFTTKLRVVFDASAKTDTGISFNDIQMVGPTIQSDLLSILLKFRSHRYVACADIAKMYRQVMIRPEQRSLQLIIWRLNPNQSIETYAFNTITYGTASSSFLSTRCLYQLRIDCEETKAFLDSNNVRRVGGRLRNSSYNFRIFPIHDITELISPYEHHKLSHAGQTQVLSAIRYRYWPLSVQRVARKVVRSCTVYEYFRIKPRVASLIMRHLPKERCTPAPPFFTIGIDYTGIFFTKENKGRAPKDEKGYVCLFICFVTRAIHLELVSDLSSDTFILVMRRFVARRGRPAQVFSDNAAKLNGASMELKALSKLLNENGDYIQNSSSDEGINWKFIPPHSPHWGGLWETGVKSTKHHLVRVLRNAHLTFKEFYTVLMQIESILNSRPISSLSCYPNHPLPITPAHFLVGRQLMSLPDPDLREFPISRLSSFQKIQQPKQHFWSRWHKEYISELHLRSKWRKNQQPLREGDNLPPQKWSLGRIISLHPGDYNIVRAASIRTSRGVIKRSFTKMCVLPIPEK